MKVSRVEGGMVRGLERTGPCCCNERVGVEGPVHGIGCGPPEESGAAAEGSSCYRGALESDRVLEGWKERIRGLNLEVAALALAMRRPDVPWYAKALGVAVIAYALSPIDLIPDFIPVLGLLDDLLLVPLGILAVRALVPPGVLGECRAEAAKGVLRPRTGWIAAVVIVAVWGVVLGGLLRWVFSGRSSTR